MTLESNAHYYRRKICYTEVCEEMDRLRSRGYTAKRLLISPDVWNEMQRDADFKTNFMMEGVFGDGTHATTLFGMLIVVKDSIGNWMIEGVKQDEDS